MAAEVRGVRARNVEQEIKNLQLLDLIVQLLAEVGAGGLTGPQPNHLSVGGNGHGARLLPLPALLRK